MALEPLSGEPGSAALLSLSLPVYTGHQGLTCANLGQIVEKAEALNAEVAKVSAEAAEEKQKQIPCGNDKQESKGKGLERRGRGGEAQSFAKEGKSRFPTGMTNKKAKARALNAEGAEVARRSRRKAH
jgi:hypothetical protein